MLLLSKLKDRIFYGWVLVATFFVVGPILWGIRFSFGVFFKSIESEFELTRVATSAIYSVQLVLGGLCSILGGWALDKHGPRIVLFFIGLMAGLGLLLTSQVGSLWQLFVTYSLLLTMGTTAMFVVTMSTVSRWFNKKRGLAMGIASSGAGLGTFIFAPFATYLITGFGWRMAYLIIGLITWLVVLPISRLLKRDPYEIGALPDGAKAPLKNGEGKEINTLTTGLSLTQVLRTHSFWLFLFIWLFIAINIYLILAHIVPHVTDIGFSTVQAAMVLSLIGGASAAGRIIMGVASDRIGRKMAAIICQLLLAGAMVWLIWADDLWMFYPFALVFGFIWGGLGPVMAAMIVDTFGLNKIGAILGMLDFGFAVGAATGPAVGGLIFDVTGSYFLAFLTGAMALFFVVLLTSLVRREAGENFKSGLTR
ncbi:MFS transporter [Chloroflexota bacterium]